MAASFSRFNGLLGPRQFVGLVESALAADLTGSRPGANSHHLRPGKLESSPERKLSM